MGAKTEIAWTDATWNCVRGCSMAKGSETGGCLNCYAARLNARNLPELKSPTTGESFARILPSGPRWTGRVELIESQLALPLSWRKPKRIFVNSMSDLFHEALTDEQIDRVVAVMALCQQHTFQVLTKRPERMLAYLTRGRVKGFGADIRWPSVDLDNLDRTWPLTNTWLGVSVEDQATADARIPLLLQTPAAIRFVSYEPALGPVDFRAIPQCMDDNEPSRAQIDGGLGLHFYVRGTVRIDQIIIGGESGPGARPFDIAWARSAVEQCSAAGVACFVKQLGAKPGQERDTRRDWHPWLLTDRKGADMAEWPKDLRVRQFPEVRR